RYRNVETFSGRFLILGGVRLQANGLTVGRLSDHLGRLTISAGIADDNVAFGLGVHGNFDHSLLYCVCWRIQTLIAYNSCAYVSGALKRLSGDHNLYIALERYIPAPAGCDEVAVLR